MTSLYQLSYLANTLRDEGIEALSKPLAACSKTLLISMRTSSQLTSFLESLLEYIESHPLQVEQAIESLWYRLPTIRQQVKVVLSRIIANLQKGCGMVNPLLGVLKSFIAGQNQSREKCFVMGGSIEVDLGEGVNAVPLTIGMWVWLSEKANCILQVSMANKSTLTIIDDGRTLHLKQDDKLLLSMNLPKKCWTYIGLQILSVKTVFSGEKTGITVRVGTLIQKVIVSKIAGIVTGMVFLRGMTGLFWNITCLQAALSNPTDLKTSLWQTTSLKALQTNLLPMRSKIFLHLTHTIKRNSLIQITNKTFKLEHVYVIEHQEVKLGTSMLIFLGLESLETGGQVATRRRAGSLGNLDVWQQKRDYSSRQKILQCMLTLYKGRLQQPTCHLRILPLLLTHSLSKTQLNLIFKLYYNIADEQFKLEFFRHVLLGVKVNDLLRENVVEEYAIHVRNAMLGRKGEVLFQMFGRLIDNLGRLQDCCLNHSNSKFAQPQSPITTILSHFQDHLKTCKILPKALLLHLNPSQPTCLKLSLLSLLLHTQPQIPQRPTFQRLLHLYTVDHNPEIWHAVLLLLYQWRLFREQLFVRLVRSNVRKRVLLDNHVGYVLEKVRIMRDCWRWILIQQAKAKDHCWQHVLGFYLSCYNIATKGYQKSLITTLLTLPPSMLHHRPLYSTLFQILQQYHQGFRDSAYNKIISLLGRTLSYVFANDYAHRENQFSRALFWISQGNSSGRRHFQRVVGVFVEEQQKMWAVRVAAAWVGMALQLPLFSGQKETAGSYIGIYDRCHFYQGIVNFGPQSTAKQMSKRIRQIIFNEFQFDLQHYFSLYFDLVNLKFLLQLSPKGLSSIFHGVFLNSEYTQKPTSDKVSFLQLITYDLLTQIEYSLQQKRDLNGYCFFLFSHLAMANILLLTHSKPLDPPLYFKYQHNMRMVLGELSKRSDNKAINTVLGGIGRLLAVCCEVVQQYFGEKEVNQILEFQGMPSFCRVGMSTMKFLASFKIMIDEEQQSVFRRIMLKSIRLDISLSQKIWQDDSVRAHLKTHPSQIPAITSALNKSLQRMIDNHREQHKYKRQQLLTVEDQTLARDFNQSQIELQWAQAKKNIRKKRIMQAVQCMLQIRQFKREVSQLRRGDGLLASPTYFEQTQSTLPYQPLQFKQSNKKIKNQFSSYSCDNGTRPFLKRVIPLIKRLPVNQQLQKYSWLQISQLLAQHYECVLKATRLKFGQKVQGLVLFKQNTVFFLTKQKISYFGINSISLQKWCQQFNVFNFKSTLHKNYLFKISDTKSCLKHLSKRHQVKQTGIPAQQTLWCQSNLSNLDYLINVNTAAGRSYQNVSEYMIFPWVLKLDDEMLDISRIRDLTVSPAEGGIQSRRKAIMDRYACKDQFAEIPPYHYGTHYSSPGMVYNFMIRLQPFSRMAKDLQGGRYDLPDRIFTNIAEVTRSLQREVTDVRQFLPQFYYLPEIFVNLDQYDFGVSQNGKRVHHVQLPTWANKNPYLFVSVMRTALQSEQVSMGLSGWLDLIFGYKQQGLQAEQAINLYYYLTYPQKSIPQDQHQSLKSQMQHFGQCPAMIFGGPHPPKRYHRSFHKKLGFPVTNHIKQCYKAGLYGEGLVWVVSGNKWVSLKNQEVIAELAIKRTPCDDFLGFFPEHVVFIAPDKLAYTSHKGTLQLYSLLKARTLSTIQPHQTPITYLSHLNNKIVTADNHGNLTISNHSKNQLQVQSCLVRKGFRMAGFDHGLWVIVLSECVEVCRICAGEVKVIARLGICCKWAGISFCTLPCFVVLERGRLASYSANGQFLASLPVPDSSQAVIAKGLPDHLILLMGDRILILRCPFLQQTQQCRLSMPGHKLFYQDGLILVEHSDNRLTQLRFD